MESLMDVNKVSSVLGVKPKTIYTWVCKGSIPYMKVGSAVRFSEKRIEKWLEERHFMPEGI
jgi:excisionase family DNA binding protein